MLTDFEIDRNLLAEVCEHWRIRSLCVFASALRDDFGPDSDVDVSIEFDPEHVPGWEIVDIGDDLPTFFGPPVRRYGVPCIGVASIGNTNPWNCSCAI